MSWADVNVGQSWSTIRHSKRYLLISNKQIKQKYVTRNTEFLKIWKLKIFYWNSNGRVHEKKLPCQSDAINKIESWFELKSLDYYLQCHFQLFIGLLIDLWDNSVSSFREPWIWDFFFSKFSYAHDLIPTF